MSKMRLSALEKRKAPWGYVFLLPWLVMFCIFFAYPLGYGIMVAFFDYNLDTNEFIGLGNFAELFQDYRFWRSLAGMFRYAVVQLPLQVFIPLWIANVIKDHGKGFTNFTKVMIYLPGVLCNQALILVWKFLYNPDYGFISEMIQGVVGDDRFSLWDSPDLAIPLISLLCVTAGLGGNTIIYTAAINGISPDYYDAAELDGASRAQQFSKITIPLVKPTILYCLITGTIAALQIFVVPQLMTKGAPDYRTSTLLLLIYDTAFGKSDRFGYASAMACILFVITSIVAVIQFRMNKSSDD